MKCCFFTIPLDKADCEKFAFTVSVLNHSQLTMQYQWIILPQGMLKPYVLFNSNSPSTLHSKNLFHKQLKKAGNSAGQINQTISILFTLNHLSYTLSNIEAAAPVRNCFCPLQGTPHALVYYKEPPDPAWKGPEPLQTWEVGYASRSPTGSVWIRAPSVCPAWHREFSSRPSECDISGPSQLEEGKMTAQHQRLLFPERPLVNHWSNH